MAGYTLMTRAAAAAFTRLRAHWPQARRLLVCCGKGNNGGDGYVIARLARESGMEVVLVAMAGSGELSGDAARAASDWEAVGGQGMIWRRDTVLPEDYAPDVVVDALFGTGLQRAVEGRWRTLIEALNAGHWARFAVDIPSGLDADTGRVLGVAIKADATATFIGRKRGMYTADGPDYSGAIYFDGLDVPATVYAREPAAVQRLVLSDVAALLGPRRRHSHKGDFGHVLVVGGAPGMPGAPRLAGEAAQRVGAGLVTVATAPEHAASLNLARPELMCAGVADGAALAPWLERATVVAIGPGLGQTPWSREMWRAVNDCDKPLVVDADALNLLAAAPDYDAQRVLTPHPGEAGRLLGVSAAQINDDRFAATAALVERFGGIALLKGCGTLVADESGMTLTDSGNPGMASGGMGDVLTGVIAGLMAQGLSAGDAARAGALLHGYAADEAATDGGERGLLASDLFLPLRRLVNL